MGHRAGNSRPRSFTRARARSLSRGIAAHAQIAERVTSLMIEDLLARTSLAPDPAATLLISRPPPRKSSQEGGIGAAKAPSLSLARNS
jgi:hypothetical protein